MLSNVERKTKTESSGRNEDGEEGKKRMKEREERGLVL
jgi:hypothetical protein